MGDVRQRSKLFLESVDGGRIGPQQRLQRDRLSAIVVEGGIDDAGAAGPDTAQNPVAFRRNEGSGLNTGGTVSEGPLRLDQGHLCRGGGVDLVRGVRTEERRHPLVAAGVVFGLVGDVAMCPFDRPKMKTRVKPSARPACFIALPTTKIGSPGTGTTSVSFMRIAWKRKSFSNQSVFILNTTWPSGRTVDSNVAKSRSTVPGGRRVRLRSSVASRTFPRARRIAA